MKRSETLLRRKDKEKKNGKYKQEKKEASYKKQKDASDNVNKHTNNLYSTKIYNVSTVHQSLAPAMGLLGSTQVALMFLTRCISNTAGNKLATTTHISKNSTQSCTKRKLINIFTVKTSHRKEYEYTWSSCVQRSLCLTNAHLASPVLVSTCLMMPSSIDSDSSINRTSRCPSGVCSNRYVQ